MQDSPYEIKEKLLRALDEEYNVVDMPAVYEVISLLEKALITKEALEKTRIGKYINELRKRTRDDQLSKRAKELVKSWRKLLPAGETLVNGEKCSNNARVSPMSVTALGSGPGPGPGPGNKHPKHNVTAPNNPRYKSSSPAVVSEHSTSPFSSSASNSPLLPSSKLQGSNRPATPSSYAPLPKSAATSSVAPRTNWTNVCGKALTTTGNHCKTASHQTFKPVSPALAACRQGTPRSLVGNATECLSHNKLISPHVSPNSNNLSPSQHVSISSRAVPNKDTSVQVSNRHMCQSTVYLPTSGIHSIVDVAKNNVANKRLRKDHNFLCNSSIQKKSFSLNNSEHSLVFNGMNSLEPSESVLPSESSAFKSIKFSNVAKSQKAYTEDYDLKPEKRRKVNNISGSVEDLIGVKEAVVRSRVLSAVKGKVSVPDGLKLDKRKKSGKLEVVNNITEKLDLLGSSSKLPKIKTPEHTVPETLLIVDVAKPEKRKKSNERGEMHDFLKEKLDKLGSGASGSKLPKVKTTQQLLADLHAKKGTLPDNNLLSIANLINNNLSEPNVRYLSSGSANLHSSDAEVSRTKSELMEKFLQSSGPSCINSDNTTPTAISETSSPFRDCTPQNCVDSCSVISTDKDVSVMCGDPVSEEINQILSQLPPLNVDEINFDDDDVPQRLDVVTDEHLDRLSKPWEGVNGVSDSNGNWRPWQDCCDVESNGEKFRILPYVNIDW